MADLSNISLSVSVLAKFVNNQCNSFAFYAYTSEFPRADYGFNTIDQGLKPSCSINNYKQMESIPLDTILQVTNNIVLIILIVIAIVKGKPLTRIKP
jgi:hypothetical protein